MQECGTVGSRVESLATVLCTHIRASVINVSAVLRQPLALALAVAHRLADLLEVPVSIVEWAHLSRLEPSTDAVEMEGMIAHTPGYSALVARGALIVRLTLDAQIPATEQHSTERESIVSRPLANHGIA